MTREEVKNCLSGYMAIEREIDDLERECETWRKRIRGALRFAAGESAVKEMTALEGELMKKTQELSRLRAHIGRCMDAVSDASLRRIVYLKYVKGLTLEKIAEEMNYSTRQVCRLHADALTKLANSV